MPRTRLALAVTAAAVLGVAPPALADSKVSIETGNFGPGLSGSYLFVRDRPSIFTDAPMNVVVSNDGTKIRISDANGDVVDGGGCIEQANGDALCPGGVDGALLWGGNKNDAIKNLTALPAAWDGDSGDDLLQGGAGPDHMDGGPGDDTLKGLGGDDTFVDEPGADDMRGGTGVDTINYASANALVKVTLDNAQFDDGRQSDPDRLLEMENVHGSAYSDFIRGNDERNAVSARAGNDTVVTLGGDDTINGNAGGDSILGGTGDDTVTYADRTARVTVSLNSLDGDGEAGESDNIYDDVENLKGGSGDDELTGQATLAVSNNFDGNGGADTLNGGAGDDNADGGAGDDIIIGDPGSDQYLGGSGIDLLDYSDRSGEFTEDLDVTLAASIFLDDGGPADGPAGFRDNASGIENLTGGDGNDKLTGAPGKNIIKAGAGDDELRVDDGVQDIADCGAGNDGVAFDLGVDLTPNCEVILP